MLGNSALNRTTDNPGPNNPQRVTQSFRDQKHLESFLRSSNLLKIIEGAANSYVKTFHETKQSEAALAAVIVRLPFHYEDFVNQPEADDLLHLAIEEPVLFHNAAKYCVLAIVRDIVKQTGANSGLKGIDSDQVHVCLRFIGLPLQRSLLFDPSSYCIRTGLSLLVGVLSAVTEIAKVVIQSVWFCNTGCSRNKIKAETSSAPICSSCSREMSEYTKLRSTQNFRLLRVLPFASVQTPRVLNKIFRAIIVRLRDHTYDCELSLGMRYLITGLYDYQGNVQEFQAWNLITH